MDLKADDNFEVVLGANKDLVLVDGHEELRQRLILRLTLLQRRIIGSKNEPNAKRKVRTTINRVLSNNELVGSIETVDVEITNKDTIETYIVYNENRVFDEEV